MTLGHHQDTHPCVMDNNRMKYLELIKEIKKNQGVFLKHYPPAATKSTKIFLASRSQGH